MEVEEHCRDMSESFCSTREKTLQRGEAVGVGWGRGGHVCSVSALHAGNSAGALWLLLKERYALYFLKGLFYQEEKPREKKGPKKVSTALRLRLALTEITVWD